ncbi:MAG: hypothetical protein J2P41_07970 [Blastocatellia bacterium]|nr:hypothetical protein [Blastocatellia bacterium]
MKYLKKILPKIGAAIVAVVLLVLLLLDLPQPFFHTSVSANNLTLYSDRPFTPESGQKVLALAEFRIAKSPLYVVDQKHLIFICNARWRQRLFFSYNYGAGGVNYYPITNVFLRDAIVEDNCLIGPNGNRVSGERTLDYFIAHEITHTLTGQAIGAIAYHRLPQWKREGYADYVGKGEAFDYADARRAFLAGDPKMDWAKSGLYWRYHLLVAHLLDKQHWSVQRLLEEPIQQEEVEDSIRAER